MIARRAFLGSLARLPLVGGAVGIIGAPTAVAEPVTPDLMEAYKAWLDAELRNLRWEMAGDPFFVDRYKHHPGGDGDRFNRSRAIGAMLAFVGKSGSYHSPWRPGAYTRAALVLSTVGCDWREVRS